MTTVNGSTAVPTAHYFHASLYKFSITGRAAVINAFYAQIGNTAAKCWYNSKKDMFSLDCPSSHGSHCDNILYDVICKYVEDEQASAQLAGRTPEVQQFAESKWSWDAERELESEYVVDDEVVRQAPLAPAVTAHTVVCPDDCKVKFFRMYQLPEAFLRRVLCPGNKTTQDILTRGLTCRTVYWKDREGFVFNGSDSADTLLPSAGYQQLERSAFPVLRDTRDQATLDSLDLTEEPIIPIDQDPVGAWAETVGRTPQVPPEEAADLPKQTKQLIAADEMRSFGRTRIPAGYSIGMIEPDYTSDDDDEPAVPVARSGFEAAMLNGDSGQAPNVSEFSESDDDSDSEGSVVPVVRSSSTVLFTSPTTRSGAIDSLEKARGRATAFNPTQTFVCAEKPSYEHQSVPEAILTPVVRSTAPQSTVQGSAEFAGYDKKYGKVDGYGLTAHPSLTASHALENAIPTVGKTKRQHIVQRTRKPFVPAGVNPDGAVSGNRSEHNLPMTSIAPTATTPILDSIRPYAPAAWEQNVSSGEIPTVGLIDARSTQTRGPLKMPPGLANTSQQSRLQNVISTQRVESNRLVDIADISLMDELAPRVSAVDRPQVGQILQPKQGTGANTDVVVDKLAVFPPAFARKRSTMNQRAGKNVKAKGKGKKSTSASSKKPAVQLPMPDLPPPPRVKKAAEIPQSSKRKQTTSAAGPAAQKAKPPPINNFQQLLLNTIEQQSMSDNEVDENMSADKAYTLNLRFCQLLLIPEDDDLSKQRASAPTVYEHLIDSSKLVSHYFPRLTASVLDANKLVSLMRTSSTPDLVYEIRMRDAANRALICTIPAADKALFTIKTRDDSSAHEFLHFPMRVWGARMSLTRSGADRQSLSYDAIVQFVSSMTTEGTAPSFCAYVQDGQPTIDAVYAHRVFETVEDGISLRIVEKQLLERIENRGGGRHNFGAVVAATEGEMIFDQRLWWEAMLETDDLGKRAELLDNATTMIEKMDGIGIQNEGPWGPGEVEGDKVAAPVLLYDELGRQHLAKLGRS